MKKQIKSYISFTRKERLGLLCLSALIIMLIAVRASMFMWVRPAHDEEKERKLVAAWESFKGTQPKIKKPADSNNSKNDFEDAFDDNQTPLPNITDINTADSSTLVRFKGIGPATAAKIIERRKNIGPFTNIEQLLEIRKIPDATFRILKEHLIVRKIDK